MSNLFIILGTKIIEFINYFFIESPEKAVYSSIQKRISYFSQTKWFLKEITKEIFFSSVNPTSCSAYLKW